MSVDRNEKAHDDVSIAFIAFSDSKGGAGIAFGRFLGMAKQYYSCRVLTLPESDYIHFFKRILCYALSSLQYLGYPTKKSLNIFSHPKVLDFLKVKSDVLHLHWVNNETFSLYQLSKLPAGSIITIHDEWLYLGVEHVTNPLNKKFDVSKSLKFWDLKSYPWRLIFLLWKRKVFRDRGDIIVTGPSRWITERASESFVLKDCRVRLLPNIIDTEVFSPADFCERGRLRGELGVEESDFVIVFGAVNGGENPLKGWSHFLEALECLPASIEIMPKIKVVLFGGDINAVHPAINGVQFISYGIACTDKELANIYSSSDLVVVTSLIESFGQVAAEAASCKRRVVGFNTSGLRDVVVQNETGFLVDQFSISMLAQSIVDMIDMDCSSRSRMENLSRQHIVENFSPSVVGSKYSKIIQESQVIRADLAANED